MFKAIELQPEQKRVLKMNYNDVVLVKGVAGSGKTTIALYRAKHLIDHYKNEVKPSSVIIFTYNKLLANYLDKLKSKVRGGYDINGENIVNRDGKPLDVEVSTFHSWVFRFIKSQGVVACDNVVNGKDIITNIVEELCDNDSDWKFKNNDVKFLIEEVAWIKGKCIGSEDEYLSTSRLGRGTSIKLSRDQRVQVWKLFSTYNKQLSSIEAMDFSDFALKALEIIDNDPNFVPPFTHIVVDEAQDLTKAQLLVIKRLVSPDTNSITIIADAAQRIYKSGFLWSEIGFEFKGRTCVLKKNYRSTIEISRAALSLLNNDAMKDEFTQIESARKGKCVPVVGKFDTSDKQWSYIKGVLPKILSEGGDVVFLHSRKDGVTKAAEILEMFGYSVNVLSEGDKKVSDNKIHICTLKSIKGLEFDTVFILGCNEGVLPSDYWNTSSMNDEMHTSTERRLLYTAMTRARERVFLMSSRTPSRFLDEIDSDYIEVV